jgi:hypothetical protein
VRRAGEALRWEVPLRQEDLFSLPRKPWNVGRLIGPKAPLKPKHIWAIRQQLKVTKRVRDLADGPPVRGDLMAPPSLQTLQKLAGETRLQAGTLEKVIRLLDLLAGHILWLLRGLRGDAAAIGRLDGP